MGFDHVLLARFHPKLGVTVLVDVLGLRGGLPGARFDGDFALRQWDVDRVDDLDDESWRVFIRSVLGRSRTVGEAENKEKDCQHFIVAKC